MYAALCNCSIIMTEIYKDMWDQQTLIGHSLAKLNIAGSSRPIQEDLIWVITCIIYYKWKTPFFHKKYKDLLAENDSCVLTLRWDRFNKSEFKIISLREHEVSSAIFLWHRINRRLCSWNTSDLYKQQIASSSNTPISDRGHFHVPHHTSQNCQWNNPATFV